MTDAPPRLTHDALEGFIADTRGRIEAVEDALYTDAIFVIRVWRLEFRMRWINRTRRPAARLSRIRSESEAA
jgi:hypothetical protein